MATLQRVYEFLVSLLLLSLALAFAHSPARSPTILCHSNNAALANPFLLATRVCLLAFLPEHN